MRLLPLILLLPTLALADEYTVTMPASTPPPEPIYAIPSNSSFRAPSASYMPPIPQNARDIEIDNTHLEVLPVTNCVRLPGHDGSSYLSCRGG